MKIIMSYLQEDEKLKECLASLKKFSPEIEIIKIKADKTKTKTSEEAFENYFKEHGFDDDYMIWHPDMRATKNWYEKLKQYYHFFDVIGCKLLYPNKLVQHYGGCVFADGRGFHPHQHCLNIGLLTPQETAYVTGPSMIIKKYVWEELKGWDHQFNYYIDADFCVRAQKKGFRVGVVPVELIHSEGEDQLKVRSQIETSRLLKEGHDKFKTKHMDFLSKYK